MSPRRPTAAPLRWLWSPRTSARLHRRLRDALVAALAHRPRRRTDPELRRLIDALERDAIALDRELVAVSAYPMAARREQLGRLRLRTAELEAAAATLAREDRVPRGVLIDGGRPVSQSILERHRLIGEARDELDRLEAVQLTARPNQRGPNQRGSNQQDLSYRPPVIVAR